MSQVRVTPPRVPVASVILTVPQGTDTIQPTLFSVLSSTLDPIEVIVMIPEPDCGLRDAVRGTARVDPRVRPVSVAGWDRATLRNAGVNSALGDTLVFMDAGTFLDPTALARMVTCLRVHPSVTVVRGRAENLPVPDHDLRAVEVIADAREGLGGDVLAVRRRDWPTLGGFDRDMEPHADRAWLLRVLATGGVVRAVTVATLGWGTVLPRERDMGSVIAATAAVKGWDRLSLHIADQMPGDAGLLVACRRQRARSRLHLARMLLAVGSGDRLRPLTVLVQSVLIDARVAVARPGEALATGLGSLAAAVLCWRLGRRLGTMSSTGTAGEGMA